MVISDIGALAVKSEHAVHSIEQVSSGPVQEANIGCGTGMLCKDFKGGTRSSFQLIDGLKLVAQCNTVHNGISASGIYQ